MPHIEKLADFPVLPLLPFLPLTSLTDMQRSTEAGDPATLRRYR
jgi:hypothetical protein